MKGVALFSGGLDSTTMVYKLLNAGHELVALSFNYGQRHSHREITSAKSIADKLGLEHIVADLPVQIFEGSALTGAGEIPEGHYADESMKATIVPNRNAIMLSLAFGLMESRKMDFVAYAAHAGDHPIYPDCRPEFVQAFEGMQNLALGRRAFLLTPFAFVGKEQIVVEGVKHNVPFSATYSCYNGRESHCGKCGTCVERREAFQLAGVEDPTRYEVEV